MKPFVALFLVFSRIGFHFVWSQETLLVRWNNSILIDNSTDLRTLIYHDEIAMRTNGTDAAYDGPGILTCRLSESDSFAGWRKPNDAGISLLTSNNDFRQFRMIGSPTRVQLARARDTLQDGASNNGLWTCNGGTQPRRHVPLYARGSGTVVVDSISLGVSSSFSSTSPRFTLIADTSGGPPTTFSWSNSDGTISNDGSNSISIEVNPNNDATGRMNCHYRSTLEVTAVAPGIYRYEADNRAVSGVPSRTFTVEGGDISNLQVVQIGSRVHLSWNPPIGPPSHGYRIVDAANNIDVPASTNIHTIEVPAVGNYNFEVMYTSQHFPAGSVTQNITVRALSLAPVISLSPPTATSVTVNWSQPMSSFEVQNYQVSVILVTSCSSIVPIRGPRLRLNTDMQEIFEDLEEFIDYRANVTAFFERSSATTTLDFTTLPTVPEAPMNVRVLNMTSIGAISITWNAMDCSDQNGPNFHYDVDFQRMDGGAVPVGTVNNLVFTVEGLRPFTNYVFRVRGVNDVGNGRYSDLAIQSNQNIPGSVANLTTQLNSFTSILITWNPPQEPNGIIIMYELSYLLNKTFYVSENTTHRLSYIIDSEVNTEIEVRVRAYTVVGPGPIETSFFIVLPSIVMNVRVEGLAGATVIVTWDRITDIPGITEYIVYYAPVSSSRKRQDNEQSVTVPSTENSVEISGLESTVEYQYQVTAIGVFGGRRFEGVRSPVTGNTRFRTMIMDQRYQVAVSVSVVVTFILTIILNNALLLVGCCIARARYNKHSKKAIADTGGGMAMKENAAYNPVTSRQQPLDDNPNANFESDYDVVK